MPFDFKMKGRFFFLSASEDDFDYDLLQNGSDELVLVWRPNAHTPWAEYPYYTKQVITNSFGRMNIDDMLPGDYAFAVGEAPVATSVADLRNDLIVDTYPNPAVDFLNINAVLPASTDVELTIYDALGKPALTRKAFTNGGTLSTTLEVGQLPAGIYSVELIGNDRTMRAVDQFVKK